jgi:hypothetical protein
VTLSCAAGSTAAPTVCSPSPQTLTPANKTPFSVAAGELAGGAANDYTFNVQAAGPDVSRVPNSAPVTLHIVSFAMSAPSPSSVDVGRGAASSPVSFQITAAGSFNQTVTVSCSPLISGASCALTPAGTVNPTFTSPVNMTASVTVPAGTAPGIYPVTIQATTTGAPAAQTGSFTLNVTSNPDFTLNAPPVFPEVNAGSTGSSAPLSVTSQDGFSGTVTLNCPATFGAGSCSISPATVSSFPATATLTINGTSFTAGNYTLSVTGTSGSVMHSALVTFSVGDYSISGPQTIAVAPGRQARAILALASLSLYSGSVTATCDASALPAAICGLSPANPIAVTSGGSTNLTATINVPNNTVSGSYNINIATHDTAGVPSHSFTFAVVVADDFLLTSGTPSQTVNAGQTSGPYNLIVQPVGSTFNGIVTLACSDGLPAQSQCAFSPSTPITPGTSAVDVVMSISTTAKQARAQAFTNLGSIFFAMWLLLPAIVIGLGAGGTRRAKRKPRALSFAGLALLMLSLLSCGGVSTGAPPPPPRGTNPRSITLRSPEPPPVPLPMSARAPRSFSS